MQRRVLVCVLAALAAMCLILVGTTGSFALTFGNAATARAKAPDAGITGSNLAIADINLENKLTADGYWNLSTWNLYVKGSLLSQNEVIHLLVWRPQALNTQFQLIVRDPVLIAKGVDGVQSIAAGATAKTRLLQKGDVLGFYIPTGSIPVIPVDLYTYPATGYDPIFDSTTGGATWTDGSVVTCSLKGQIRQYALNADLVPATTSAPEPATIVALATGLLGLAWRRRK